jgi:phospholipase/carboxylesterase
VSELNVHLFGDPAGARAACLVLHGLGDSHRGWAPVVPMLDLTSMAFALADAPLPYGDGYSWFDISVEGGLRVDLDQVRAARALIEAAIARLLARLGLPRERLCLMGFSQGALMALEVALRADEAYGGVVAISGFVADPGAYPAAFGTALKRQRILMTHGRYDGLIPFAPVSAQAERLRALGAPLEWRAYDKDHGLDTERELGDIRAFLATGLDLAQRQAR